VETPRYFLRREDAMKKRLNVVRIQMVRESEIEYEAKRITQSEQAATAFRALVGDPDQEICCVLMLDGKNRIVSIHQVSQGSLNQSVVHPREVFKAAILSNAAAVVLAHNHPSGDSAPSREDIEITKRLKEAGEILGIKVLDHVIVDTCSGQHCSLANQGII